MNFKNTDSLFNKIKEDLYSWDAAGLLDEGKFFKDVQYILATLGVMWYRDEDQMLRVKDYRVCLPDGFTLLEALYKCDQCGTSSVPASDGIVFSELTFSHYPETQIPDPHVPLPCPVVDYWSQDPSLIFDVHKQLLIQRGDFVHTYNPPILMRAGNVITHGSCSKTCPNVYSQCKDTFTIQNGKVYTNFKDGDMLMFYKAFPLDEDTSLPLIPDNPIIEKAIEDYIKYNIIKNLRTNGDVNVAQLLPIYLADMDKSMGKAITETKTPSFETMVHNVRLVKRRLNIYQFPNMSGR